MRKGYKAKDTPWDADLTGSVACTVSAKLCLILINANTLFNILFAALNQNQISAIFAI